VTQRFQVAEVREELMRSESAAKVSEKAGLEKELKRAEARAAALEASLTSLRNYHKDKDKAEKERAERAEAQAKAQAKAERDKESPLPGVDKLFAHLYNGTKLGYLHSRAAAKNASEAVPAALAKATGAAKGLAHEMGHTATKVLEAVKHGFEAQATVG